MTAPSARLYEFLANEEDARACKDISDDACREVPGNFLLILSSQFLTKVADALSSSRIVLPWLLSSIGAPTFFSGLLVPVRESGSLLPQLVIGGFVRRQPLRKWFFVAGSVMQGLCVGGMAWIALEVRGTTAAFGILILLVLFSLARGLCSVASKDVLGKTIPKRRRGTLSGYGASLAGLVTIGAGLMLGVGINRESGMLYLLLLAALGCWLLAALAYANIKEYQGATEGGGNALREAISSLGILRTDVNFRRFVLTRCLLMSSGLSAPYFVILANQSGDDGSLSSLGLFLGVSGLASLISGYLWGRFADSSSRAVMLVTALCTAGLCSVAAWLSASAMQTATPLLVFLFFLLSVVHQGVRLGRKTYIVDLAGGNKRTEYVTVSNTLIGVMLLLIGLASAITATLSLTAVLVFFAASSLAALVVGIGLPEID